MAKTSANKNNRNKSIEARLKREKKRIKAQLKLKK